MVCFLASLRRTNLKASCQNQRSDNMKDIPNISPDTRERVTIVSPKDLEFSYFAGGGNGGQAKNKIKSGCQIKHTESGAIGRASDSRSLLENKQAAFSRLLLDPRMKFFISKAVYAVRHEESLEESIQKETTDSTLRFEIKDEMGRWTEVTAEYFEGCQAREVVPA